MIEIYNLRSSYKYYKSKESSPVDVKIYLKIIHGYIKFIMKKVFDGWDVQLSGNNSLGVIGVRGTKIKPKLDEDTGGIRGLAPDWGATRKLWLTNEEARKERRVIFHFNEHSDGIMYRLVWHKADVKLVNKTYYNLNFSRTNKRTVSKLIKSGKEYIVNVK